MNQTYNEFRCEALKAFPSAETTAILRHYRKWQKIHKDYYKNMTMQAAQQAAREYLKAYSPQEKCQNLSGLRGVLKCFMFRNLYVEYAQKKQN